MGAEGQDGGDLIVGEAGKPQHVFGRLHAKLQNVVRYGEAKFFFEQLGEVVGRKSHLLRHPLGGELFVEVVVDEVHGVHHGLGVDMPLFGGRHLVYIELEHVLV